jgi:hypothetical protein
VAGTGANADALKAAHAEIRAQRARIRQLSASSATPNMIAASTSSGSPPKHHA